MKFSSIFGLAAIANMVQGSPIAEPHSLEARADMKCRLPGSHRCSVIVWASVQSNGLTQGTGASRGVQVVDGSCNNIITGGSLKPGGGWSADFSTAYGPHLYFGASNLGVRTISGVRFQYNGKSYEQKHCVNSQQFGGDRVVDLPGLVFLRGTDSIQCDFDC